MFADVARNFLKKRMSTADSKLVAPINLAKCLRFNMYTVHLIEWSHASFSFPRCSKQYDGGSNSAHR